ncbi:MAG: hypothetical protein A2Y79_04850 [Deltaproteobacteria bacterium RBG_13_43_22]|nr:MAG: hypothetical protein A2Y79_04850 [Deltaproteobacteria bacterium RBG_13_43_22]
MKNYTSNPTFLSNENLLRIFNPTGKSPTAEFWWKSKNEKGVSPVYGNKFKKEFYRIRKGITNPARTGVKSLSAMRLLNASIWLFREASQVCRKAHHEIS